MNPIIQTLINEINSLDLKPSDLDAEYRYESLPLCIIDAVYSIGVKYSSVKNVIANFCEHFNCVPLVQDRYSRQKSSFRVLDLIHLYQRYSVEEMAQSVYQNKQRTSTRSGILKAEAVYHFAIALQNAGINDFIDLTPNKLLIAELSVLQIPGQKSGISFDYFKMLAGDDQVIKPDRMVLRFLQEVLNFTALPTERFAQVALSFAAQGLGKEWTPLKLDQAIWNYQKVQSK